MWRCWVVSKKPASHGIRTQLSTCPTYGWIGVCQKRHKGGIQANYSAIHPDRSHIWMASSMAVLLFKNASTNAYFFLVLRRAFSFHSRHPQTWADKPIVSLYCISVIDCDRKCHAYEASNLNKAKVDHKHLMGRCLWSTFSLLRLLVHVHGAFYRGRLLTCNNDLIVGLITQVCGCPD